jgi:hypothetical protein
MQRGTAVERNGHPESAFAVDGWLPFDRRSSKPARSRARSASGAVYRGSLGIHLNGSGEDLTAEEHIALVGRQRLQV